MKKFELEANINRKLEEEIEPIVSFSFDISGVDFFFEGDRRG